MKIIAVIMLMSAVASCRPGRVTVEPVPSAGYSHIKISAGVSARPGGLSWSPDNKRIAFIDKTLNIFDIEGKKQTGLDIKEPFFVSWAEGADILVLFKEDGRKALGIVDAGGLSVKKIRLDPEPEAIFPLRPYGSNGAERLLILSSKIKVLSFGTDLSYSLFIYNIKDGTTKNIYTSSRIYPVKNPNIGYLPAWIHAGLNPLDGSFLIMEQIKPPVVRPYSKVGIIDHVTGKIQALTGDGNKKFYISASWSPDGTRLVLTGEDGRLEILGIYGGTAPVYSAAAGLYPSWNPGGSQIFSGGYIISSDGKNKEELLPGSAESIAWWSPDGTKIAVISGDGLHLLEGFNPYFIYPDKPFNEHLSKKVVILKGLLSEGLLTENEYRERFDALLKEREGLR